MVALLLALQAAGPPVRPQTGLARARAVVVETARGVSADGGGAMRRQWTQRLRRDGRDREARLGLATVARLTYDFVAADSAYARLLPPLGTAASDAIGLYALLGSSLAASQRWRFAEAARGLERTVVAAERLGDSRAQAEALIALAGSIARSAGVDSARVLLDRAGVILPRTDTALTIMHFCALAGLLRGTSPIRADSLVESGITLATASGEDRLRGRCLIARSLVHEVRGRQKLSLGAAWLADSLLRAQYDYDGAATASQLIAYQATYTINFEQGRRAAAAAIEFGKRSGNVGAVAWALLNRAQLALRVDDAPAAARDIEESLRQLTHLGDRTGVAAALVVRGDAAQALGLWARARAAYDSAAALYSRMGWETLVPALEFKLAAIDRLAGEAASGLRRLEHAVALAERLGLAGLTRTDQHYARGLSALHDERWEDAVREFRTFLERVGSVSVHYTFDGRARLAEAEAGAGRLDDAVRTLERGFLDLDVARSYLTDRDARIAALQGRRLEFDPDLGVATIVSHLAVAGRVETAFAIAEAQRARHLWIQMVRRGAFAGDTAAPARGAHLLPEVLDIDAIRRSLPDSTAVLAWVTGRGGEATTGFVLSREAGRAVALPPGDSLGPEIQRFAVALESGTPARSLARRLSDRLFNPLTAALPRDVVRLVLVPDGPLHRLPFDALVLSDGKTALERYTMTLAPSVRVAAALWTSSRAEPGRRGVLAFGDPVFAPDEPDLPRLRASREEVRLVSRSARAEVRSRRDASEAELKRLAGSARGVLHLATHARVEDSGLLSSALFLSPGGGEDGRVGVEEIAALGLETDLVVLSACSTIGGAIVSGEGIQGLTAPFLETGARAVLAIQWPIRDGALVPVIGRFYEGMARGLGAADALHAARLEAFRAGASPTVWAAPAFTGDPRLRPQLR
jgi:tetratricopeptide (TPR) repeat protein